VFVDEAGGTNRVLGALSDDQLDAAIAAIA
jgi:hypothetical protein